MVTQVRCEKALSVLSRRVKRSAFDAGYNTVRSLSIASTVSRSGISKIYNREHYPTFDTLLSLAKVCGTTVHKWTDDLEQENELELPEQENEIQPEPEMNEQDNEFNEGQDVEPEPINPVQHLQDDDDDKQVEPEIDLLAFLHGMKPNQ